MLTIIVSGLSILFWLATEITEDTERFQVLEKLSVYSVVSVAKSYF